MGYSKLTAQELRRRYRQGERHFANIDLNGESLPPANKIDGGNIPKPSPSLQIRKGQVILIHKFELS